MSAVQAGVDAPTVVASGSYVRGDLLSASDMHVLGRVDGTIDVAGVVLVGPGAIVRGAIAAHAVAIAGVVVGDVAARDVIVLHASARVVGDLAASSIRIEEGAQLRGIVANFTPEDAYAPHDANPARHVEGTHAVVHAAAGKEANAALDEGAVDVADVADVAVNDELAADGARGDVMPPPGRRSATSELPTTRLRTSAPAREGSAPLQPPPARGLPRRERAPVVVKRR